MREPLQVLVACRLPKEARLTLAEAFPSMSTDEDAGACSTELRRILTLGPSDVVVTSLETRIDRDFVMSLSKPPRVFAIYASGLDHVDIAAARDRQIKIVHAASGHQDAVAEVAIYLLLAIVREMHLAEQALRAGAWGGWSPEIIYGRSLAGLRLAIVGYGRVGRAISKRASAFGMNVGYIMESSRDVVDRESAQRFGNLESLFRWCDAVVLACPLTDKTYHLVNAESLAWLPYGSHLVNVGRGSLIDDRALQEALSSGHIGGAGLDVYSNEPQVDDAYLKAANVVTLPHVGSATVLARRAMALELVRKIQRAVRN